MPHDDDHTMALIARVCEPSPHKRRAYATTLTRGQHGHRSQRQSPGRDTSTPHGDRTEEDVPDDDVLFGADQAELRDERARAAKRLDKLRFVGLTECELDDVNDLLVIRRLLWPDRQHALSLASTHLRVGVEHCGQAGRAAVPIASADPVSFIGSFDAAPLPRVVSGTMPEVIEAYREFNPPCNARETVRDLLSSVPEKYTVGLWRVVLTNGAALTGRRPKSWSWARGRKARHTEVLGLYHHERRGEPAWVELFVDKIAEGAPKWGLGVGIVRDTVFGNVLYHELGHHIHARQRPEHREREDVADDWKRRLVRGHIRQRYPVLRVCLWPIGRLARLMSGPPARPPR